MPSIEGESGVLVFLVQLLTAQQLRPQLARHQVVTDTPPGRVRFPPPAPVPVKGRLVVAVPALPGPVLRALDGGSSNPVRRESAPEDRITRVTHFVLKRRAALCRNLRIHACSRAEHIGVKRLRYPLSRRALPPLSGRVRNAEVASSSLAPSTKIFQL